MKLETKIKKWNKSKWKSELDRVFSIYIRNKYAKNGLVNCYTCDTEKPIEEMHCGHFNPRQYLDTRWDERNCRPQCPHCNTFNNGQPTIFARKLVAEYGEGILNELSKNNFNPVILEIPWYVEKYQKYSDLIESPQTHHSELYGVLDTN